MSRKMQNIDVLTVMARCLETAQKIADAMPGDARAALFANDVANANAAMAELIAADTEYNEAAHAIECYRGSGRRSGRASVRARWDAAKARRRVALARVGGPHER